MSHLEEDVGEAAFAALKSSLSEQNLNTVLVNWGLEDCFGYVKCARTGVIMGPASKEWAIAALQNGGLYPVHLASGVPRLRLVVEGSHTW